MGLVIQSAPSRAGLKHASATIRALPGRSAFQQSRWMLGILGVQSNNLHEASGGSDPQVADVQVRLPWLVHALADPLVPELVLCGLSKRNLS